MPDPNVKAVQDKLAQRAARGLSKYGVDTTRDDLSEIEWLIHAQDEALDLAVYLQRRISDLRERDRLMGLISAWPEERGAIRICAKRDGPCPNGMTCQEECRDWRG